MQLPESVLKNRRLETLVENQTSYALNNAEMHVFETHQTAEQVLLKFHYPVLASMLEGKKVMHLHNSTAFDFLPGESLILPPDELMCIDFPEAQMKNPTRCLAMTISEDKITETVQHLNESRAKADGEWRFTDYNFHFSNDLAIQQILHRLLFLFAEDHTSKDMFVDFMLRELIIRILQAETKKIYTEQTLQLDSNHRLAYIIQYIRKNLDKDLSVKELSNKLYMSESNFHRVFKNELNSSPIDFINNERIKLAVSLLKDPRKKVKEVYMECGFNSLSYFIRTFRQKKQVSPKEFQLKAVRGAE
ncbi:MAG: AraC family transcriptional regulator [Lewinellaceae bacterium]|nr:AraC family transcriptional regulator [Saprospiraceae bacterium]MCB9315454.1 AraC family transcriptional regulator [Lewinellaceae bacterium]MCB9331132.1 AraC family transcriptional regulator [Lewinellaceae bacterium]